MCEAWDWMRKPEYPHGIVLSSIDDEYYITYYTPWPLEFCPWCGAKLPNEDHT